ncbi:MAG: AAA family ATPase [Dehalococcoidia bacterium]|nr:AAA family ATPase [Dehalococcoidia bacterium]
MAITAVIDVVATIPNARGAAALLAADVAGSLGVTTGDLVKVTSGRGRTALIRITGEASNPGTLRLHRLSLRALRVQPEEQVTIERSEAPAAARVVLMPGYSVLGFNPQFVTYAKQLLANPPTPVTEGTLVAIPHPTSNAEMTLEVHSMTGGEGLLTADTELFIEVDPLHEHEAGATHRHGASGATAASGSITYDDIGGLHEQLKAVREFVELPLVFPETYRQLGITPPRGIIFYGAPGTGKTLLARAVANEVNAHFYYINGPEVVGSYSGQTEENLRKLFRSAYSSPPAIIFIDELDVIAPVRGDTGTLSDTRAVTQLLTLMDGLQQAEGIMVIGTTNRIETIDPALRRPGRFDKEIYFPTPPADAREEILRIHTREMPLTADALKALPAVAQRCYGYVGADLMELSREAGLTSLRRAAAEFLNDPQAAAKLDASQLTVSAADFDVATSVVRPASMRESLLSYPTVRWADIGGLNEAKRRLIELVQRPLKQPEALARLRLPSNLGILLYGPPGTGKTLLAQAVGREFGLNFIGVNGPELFSSWIGETEENVRHIFNLARRVAPSVIFFDQLDAIAPNRTASQAPTTGSQQRIVNQLLTELDGMEGLNQVFVIAATNNFEVVDPGLLRPGRFGVHLQIGLPDEAERADIFQVQLRGVGLAPGLDLDSVTTRLAAATPGKAGADLAYVCQAAKMRALDRAEGDGNLVLTQADFDQALAEFHAERH